MRQKHLHPSRLRKLNRPRMRTNSLKKRLRLKNLTLNQLKSHQKLLSQHLRHLRLPNPLKTQNNNKIQSQNLSNKLLRKSKNQ
jgi:hypothetical protein